MQQKKYGESLTFVLCYMSQPLDSLSYIRKGKKTL